MAHVIVTTGLGLALLALTVAAPAHAASRATTRCITAAAQAGILSSDRNPGTTNFVGGTDGDDTFSGVATPGPDVFCGFGGNDRYTDELRNGDVFLGGAGDDEVGYLYGGTFNGGAGDDAVINLYDGGTFNGAAGNDFLAQLVDGTFNGGVGTDSLDVQYGGTFNGGADADSVVQLVAGTFNGEAGPDSVAGLYGGTFNGGADADVVTYQEGGIFNQE